MHIKSEKITEARGRAGEIYSSSATRHGDVVAKAIRIAAVLDLGRDSRKNYIGL